MGPACRGKPRRHAPVAQWIELLVSTQSVGGSSPSGRTIDIAILRSWSPQSCAEGVGDEAASHACCWVTADTAT